MKIIKYKSQGLLIRTPWSETGEEIAKKKAENGEYSVVDITDEEAAEIGFLTNKEPTTDDVIDVLLGVAK